MHHDLPDRREGRRARRRQGRHDRRTTGRRRFAAIDAIFREPGASLVIEDFLEGEEASFFALSDGKTVIPFGTAQDHKRAFDGDEGPNTGGMGAYSPAPIVDDAMSERVMAEIIRPTVAALARRGIPYRGVLFAGLMIDAEGPKLIEYNVRFGDPECQVLMLRLKDDLLTILNAAVDGVLDQISVRWRDGAGAHRRDGDRGLSRRLSSADRKSGASTRRPPCPTSKSFTPERAARAAGFSPTAAGCSTSPRSEARSPRRRRAPTRPSTASTGRRASAAATSAGARSVAGTAAEPPD